MKKKDPYKLYDKYGNEIVNIDYSDEGSFGGDGPMEAEVNSDVWVKGKVGIEKGLSVKNDVNIKGKVGIEKNLSVKNDVDIKGKLRIQNLEGKEILKKRMPRAFKPLVSYLDGDVVEAWDINELGKEYITVPVVRTGSVSIRKGYNNKVQQIFNYCGMNFSNGRHLVNVRLLFDREGRYHSLSFDYVGDKIFNYSKSGNGPALTKNSTILKDSAIEIGFELRSGPTQDVDLRIKNTSDSTNLLVKYFITVYRNVDDTIIM